MSATARLVVQMTPDEKTSLDSRARRAGVSTAEFVRRRIGQDDLGDRREEIEILLATLEGSAPVILGALEGAIETANALQKALDDVQGAS